MSIERKSKQMLMPKIGKITIIVIAVLFIVTGYKAYELFMYTFKPAVKIDAVVYIPTGADFKQVENILEASNAMVSMKGFRWVAKKKEYPKTVKPGRYKLTKGMNTNQLVNRLRSGNQSPVRVTITNVRTWEDLAGKVAGYLEPDSVVFLQYFRDTTVSVKYGFNPESFKAMFIPNTYEFYWNTTPEAFVERMHQEYQKFWNSDRKQKADSLGMTMLEVSTLASIVQEESNKHDERPVVAGVYMNRLKRGMLLQACPTVKYAVGDFTLRRITTEMTRIDSPFNTYVHAGLPPAPITFPEITSIDAVLKAQKHNYLYFCAKDDFSGYNVFAQTLEEHNRNAARYQRELNRNNIYR
jgi:UPF0755 protein